LESVERRALRMARFSSQNSSEALDLVQEAMMKFSAKYAGRPETEWPALFHRVLQSRILDWHRRNTVRRRIFGWLRLRREGEEEGDPLEKMADLKNPGPFEKVFLSEAGAAIEKAVKSLPVRQRQAFLLRAWEGLDIARTAAAMGCSEGSIKTHYARAVSALRARLEGFAHE
jgi:RNA polymerase sigma-70 factor, ECF subfamily